MLPVFSFPSPLFWFLKKIKAKCSLKFLNFYALSTHPSPPPSGNLYLNSRISTENVTLTRTLLSCPCGFLSLWRLLPGIPKTAFTRRCPLNIKGIAPESVAHFQKWRLTAYWKHRAYDRKFWTKKHLFLLPPYHLQECTQAVPRLLLYFIWSISSCAECVEFSKPWIRQSRVVSNIHRTWIWLAENEHPVGLAGQFNKIGSIKVLFHLLED